MEVGEDGTVPLRARRVPDSDDRHPDRLLVRRHVPRFDRCSKWRRQPLPPSSLRRSALLCAFWNEAWRACTSSTPDSSDVGPLCCRSRGVSSSWLRFLAGATLLVIPAVAVWFGGVLSDGVRRATPCHAARIPRRTRTALLPRLTRGVRGKGVPAAVRGWQAPPCASP